MADGEKVQRPFTQEHQDRIDGLLAANMTLQVENERLVAMLVKVRKSVGWWAALSYPDGANGQRSRWSDDERALLHRLPEDSGSSIQEVNE